MSYFFFFLVHADLQMVQVGKPASDTTTCGSVFCFVLFVWVCFVFYLEPRHLENKMHFKCRNETKAGSAALTSIVPIRTWHTFQNAVKFRSIFSKRKSLRMSYYVAEELAVSLLKRFQLWLLKFGLSQKKHISAGKGSATFVWFIQLQLLNF